MAPSAGRESADPHPPMACSMACKNPIQPKSHFDPAWLSIRKMIDMDTMKKILAAIDFSDATPGVLETATRVTKAFDASLTVIHVVEPEPSYTAYGFTPDEFPAMHAFQQEARRRAQNRLDEIVESLKPDVAHASGVIAEGSPLHCMLEHVDKNNMDLVIVGSHGHGALASLLLGSVAEGMVRKAKIPTLVVPATAE